MQPTATPPDRTAGVALLTRLAGLLREVEEINRQLERIEGEMQRAFSVATRERVEEYR